ncbi:MAG: hypothetical protein WCK89_03285, partial [bacterium]
MRPNRISAMLALVAGVACAGEWRVTREIAGKAETAAVVAVKADEHVFANSLPDLADVRVLDAQSGEVPRVVEAERGYALK